MQTELPWAGVFLGVAGLVAAPILIHFALHPEHFFVRIEAVWLLRESQGTSLEILLNSVWKHLLVFGFFGGRAEWYGFSGQPLLNSWEGVFFWLGAGTAAWRWQRPAYRPASSLAGRACPAGHAGPRFRPGTKHLAFDRRGAGRLSAHWCGHVGGVPCLEGGDGVPCRGGAIQSFRDSMPGFQSCWGGWPVP